MQKELYLIKIGGSIITDTAKESTPKINEIERLLNEIKSAKEEKGFDIILGHGAGSYGHIPAKRYKIQEGLASDETRKGMGIIHQSMLSLNKIIVEKALEMGMFPYHFLPSSFAHSRNKVIVGGDASSIKIALEKGFMPIVHGDGMMDLGQGVSIASTEEVFRFLSTKLKVGKIILGTDTDGVYDKDPSFNKDAKLIEKIDSKNIEDIISTTGGAKKVDVTGGMKTKLSLIYESLKANNSIGYIANAGRKGVIGNILTSRPEKYTLISR
ncbi:MAG: isopentenyl phosphate kinase [Candidatus Micrarchaeales archaeon]